jgi:hypothetical protein
MRWQCSGGIRWVAWPSWEAERTKTGRQVFAAVKVDNRRDWLWHAALKAPVRHMGILCARALAKAVASCTSLCFLKLGVMDIMFGSMALRHELFHLLAPLPIKMLCIHGHAPLRNFTTPSELISCLRLFPKLSVAIFRAVDAETARRLKSQLGQLVFETLDENATIWPPVFHKLSPKAQARFEHGPYRALSSTPFSPP